MFQRKPCGVCALHDVLAGDGGGYDGPASSALYLLNSIYRGQPDDGCAVNFYRLNGPLDGGGVYQGAHGIMHQDDVVIRSGQMLECLAHRVLASVSTFYNPDPRFERVIPAISASIRLISGLRTAT